MENGGSGLRFGCRCGRHLVEGSVFGMQARSNRIPCLQSPPNGSTRLPYCSTEAHKVTKRGDDVVFGLVVVSISIPMFALITRTSRNNGSSLSIYLCFVGRFRQSYGSAVGQNSKFHDKKYLEIDVKFVLSSV